jgi:hypothetical protein
MKNDFDTYSIDVDEEAYNLKVKSIEIFKRLF